MLSERGFLSKSLLESITGLKGGVTVFSEAPSEAGLQYFTM